MQIVVRGANGLGGGYWSDGTYTAHGTRNGATEFVRDGGGILYFDADYWKLYPEKKIRPGATGWNFSQKGSKSGPPLGSWEKAKRKSGETDRDYSSLTLSRG